MKKKKEEEETKFNEARRSVKRTIILRNISKVFFVLARIISLASPHSDQLIAPAAPRTDGEQVPHFVTYEHGDEHFRRETCLLGNVCRASQFVIDQPAWPLRAFPEGF